MDLTASQLEFLCGERAAELLAMGLPAEPLRAVDLLRRHCSPDEAAAVVTLGALRRRAVVSGRFPEELAAEMLATDKLLQQASSMRMAIWKGRRLAELLGVNSQDGPGAEVWDLCCGLGSDSIGLARAGFGVRGVDSDPAAVLCAAHNARAAGVGERCSFEAADVDSLALPADAVVHIDPDRRVSGRRAIELGDFSPAGGTLARIVARTRAGALKLPPGADALELDPIAAGLFEYVSEAGICKQLVAWWHHEGNARRDVPARRATVITGPPDDPRATSIDAGVAPYAPICEPGPWLIEPDPALVAAEAVDDLAAEAGLWRVAVGLPWLFGDKPAHTPLASCFEVLADVPGRNHDIARAVRKLGGGDRRGETARPEDGHRPPPAPTSWPGHGAACNPLVPPRRQTAGLHLPAHELTLPPRLPRRVCGGRRGERSACARLTLQSAGRASMPERASSAGSRSSAVGRGRP